MWNKLLRTILQLISTLIIIGLSSYAVYAARTQSLSTNGLLALILATLTLLAINELVNRYLVLDRIAASVDLVADFVQAATEGHMGRYFLKERKDFPNLDARIQNAKEIWLLGTSLAPVLTSNSRQFASLVRSGCKMRFLLMDPNSTAVEAKSYGLYAADTPEQLRADINHACRSIHNLRKEQQSDGQVQMTLTRFVPTFSMLAINPKMPDGQIVIELYPYLATADSRPHFELRPPDVKWFVYFVSQFEDIAEAAERESAGANV